MEQTFTIPYKTLDRSELSEQDRQLEERALEVARKAYAPYSRFHVGAAVLLANGEIVTGSNQENAAYPRGLVPSVQHSSGLVPSGPMSLSSASLSSLSTALAVCPSSRPAAAAVR